MKSNIGSADVSVSPFIDGESSKSTSDATMEVTNPSNGKRNCSIPAGDESDVDRAVASARRAFDNGQWSESAPSFRKKVLHRFAGLIEEQSLALDTLDAGEMGKPISLSFCNAAASAGLMRFFAEAIDKVIGDLYPSDTHSFVTQRRVPRGVVGAIVPWNFPTFVTVLKIAPALAAGNCVVLKPSELSSQSALLLSRLGMEAGLPPGVLNVVPGAGETVGRALGLHEKVDMLSFTGSTAVGKLMLQYAGQSNMKVVIAECGGKSPQIVFGDGVDLDDAASSIAQFLLTNQGQICSVGSRLLVQRAVESELVEKIGVHLKRIVMGNALDPETTFGPLASAQQLARVLEYIEVGQSEGAQLILGGHRVMQESGGYFVEPTIFRSVASSARIAQEEVFGPVLTVIPFDDEVEAVRIANSTAYGLAAYVWTASLATGMRVAKGVRSAVFINASAPKGEGAGHSASTEPMGESGVGTEGGLAGMESYMRRQLVWFNHG